MQLQVSGVCIQQQAWSNVVCEYDTDTQSLVRVQTRDVHAVCLLMHPGAEYMVFELQSPEHVAALETILPPLITCMLVTVPCVVLHASLKAITVPELQAACAIWPAVQLKRHQLQLNSMLSSWMLQPKQPKEWGEKKTGGVRKVSLAPKKRRVRVQEEVVEEEDEVPEDVVDERDVEEDDVEVEGDDADDDDVEVEGEDVDVDDGGDDAECDDGELEEDDDGELEEEADDAVSTNSCDDEEVEGAGGKRMMKKARRA